MAHKIAVFASGTGSNAVKLHQHFIGHNLFNVELVVCNNKKAKIIDKCVDLGLDCILVDRNGLYDSNYLMEILEKREIEFIVLAGFLWKIPEKLIAAYPNKMVNIHPSLLPKYGGKGMYGMNVHKAVVDSGETESGISIHVVNEAFDEGEILFQAKVELKPDDSPEMVQKKVQTLEHEHFAKEVEHYFKRLI